MLRVTTEPIFLADMRELQEIIPTMTDVSEVVRRQQISQINIIMRRIAQR